MPDKITSLKFQLAGTLREWLEQLSAESGRSLAEEIRQQIGIASMLDRDRPTRLLCEEIWLLANEVKKEVGERWYEDDRARAIFAAAVVYHITNHGKADAPYRKDPARVETEESLIGGTIARMFRRR